MKWSKFYELFEDTVMPKDQLKGLDVVYIISHIAGRPPYKIGITETNIYGRLRAYQTPLVEFDIAYLIALPPKGARALETALQEAKYLKPIRVEFPAKKAGKKPSYSEWFDVKLVTIRTAIWREIRSSEKIFPYFAYDLTGNVPVPWASLSTFETEMESKGAAAIGSGPFEKYRWMKVKSSDPGDKSVGVVIDVPENKKFKKGTTKAKAIVRWGKNEVYPLPIEDIVQYGYDYHQIPKVS